MEQLWLGLTGQRVVVTGAAGGIGLAVARAFVGAGAHVALVDRLGADLDGALKLARADRTAVEAIECDITLEAEIDALVRQVTARWGGVDILVNNAGILRPGSVNDVPATDWLQTFDINLHGAFNMARAFTPGMRAQGRGVLVHVASIAGSNPQPFSAAYSPSKAALLMMSEQLAVEMGPEGIRSNCVSPGLVRTSLSEPFYRDERLRVQRENVVPSRSIATPDQIADVVLFLASDRAAYINGHNLTVDGGYSRTLMTYIPRPGFGN